MTKIVPTIQGDQITSITIDGYPLVLRAPFPLNQLAKLIEELETITKFIDFAASPRPGVKIHLPITDDWTPEHLIKLGELSRVASTFLTILALNHKKHSLVEIAEGTSIPRRFFQGAIRSICSYTSNHRLPPLYRRSVEQMEIPCKAKKRPTITYKLNPKYRVMIETVLDEVWNK